MFNKIKRATVAIALVSIAAVALAMPAGANYADTLKAMLALANKGDAEAQYHVGMMYNNGIGTKQNPKQAFEWFQKSAASNDPLEAYKLGCYYAGQWTGVVKTDPGEALKYKLIAAEAGYALAQHDVALHYGKMGNVEEAIKWLKTAGDQGDSMSLHILAGIYYEGRDVPKDLSLAYAYLKLSKLASENKINSTAQAVLNETAAKMSKPELENAEKLVSEWKPQPTALTLKAKIGFRAAEAHLKNANKQ